MWEYGGSFFAVITQILLLLLVFWTSSYSIGIVGFSLNLKEEVRFYDCDSTETVCFRRILTHSCIKNLAGISVSSLEVLPGDLMRLH